MAMARRYRVLISLRETSLRRNAVGGIVSPAP